MTRDDADAGGYARLATNTAATLAGRVVSVAIALVLSTVLFRRLGPGPYGVWSFCYILVGYLTLLDFGLGATVERLVAQAHAQHDGRRAERVVQQAITFAAAIAVLVQAALLLVPLQRLSTVDVRAVRLVLPACLFLSLISTITGASLSGTQDLARLNLFRSVMNLVGTTVVMALAWTGVTQVGWLLAAHGLGLVGAAALSSREVSRKLGGMRLGLTWDSGLAREFLRFGGQTQVATFGPQLADQFLRVLLGVRFGAAMIGFYDLGSRAGMVARSIAGSLLVAMVPFGTRLHQAEGCAALERLYRVGVKYSALCLLPVTGLALYHSRTLIELWLPQAPGLEVVLFVFRLSLVAQAVLGLSGPIMMVARSAGMPANEAIVQAVAGLVGLGLAAATSDARVSVAAFTGAAVAGALVLWRLLAARLGFRGTRIWRDLLVTAAVTVAMVLVLVGADHASGGVGPSQGAAIRFAWVALTSLAALAAGAALVMLSGLVAPAERRFWSAAHLTDSKSD